MIKSFQRSLKSLKYLLEYYVTLIIAFDDAIIFFVYLNLLFVLNCFCSSPRLVKKLTQHYLTMAMGTGAYIVAMGHLLVWLTS